MLDSDLAKFTEILDSLSEYYQSDPLSPIAVKIYFRSLKPYSLETLSHAVTKHITDPKAGRFYPKVADFMRFIEGGEVTHDRIIAEARQKTTPMGILCRIQIGTWDLNNQTDMFYLRQRAEECLMLLPEWKERSRKGEYTDHEIMIMLKHGVDPRDSFTAGMPAPECAQKLLARSNDLSKTERYKFLIEPPYNLEADGIP